MAIYRPGERHRYHHILKRRKGKRAVVALLSLTAMVDMFTVLVIFLLQNFSGDQQMLQLHKDIELPQAKTIKELKPAFVVTISPREILVDETVVALTEEVRQQEDWSIEPLQMRLEESIAKARVDFETKLRNRIRDVVQAARSDDEEDPNSWNKITIQADRNIDILTVKKVMYTVTEAGGGEINFAVLKEPDTAATTTN